MKLKRKQKIDAKKWLMRSAIALLALVAAFAGGKIISVLASYKTASGEYESIKAEAVAVLPPAERGEGESAVSYLSVNDDALYARNGDYSFWVDIPGAKLSYPVVYAENYEEYIHTTFDGAYNPSGSIFLDYRCERDLSSRNTVLYGHNMYDGSMFNTLRKYNDANYFKEHNKIYVYIGKSVFVYKVFSFFETEAASSAYDVNFAGDRAFTEHLDRIAASSWYISDFVPDARKSILTLSTCSRDEGDERWVLVAGLDEIARVAAAE